MALTRSISSIRPHGKALLKFRHIYELFVLILIFVHLSPLSQVFCSAQTVHLNRNAKNALIAIKSKWATSSSIAARLLSSWNLKSTSCDEFYGVQCFGDGRIRSLTVSFPSESNSASCPTQVRIIDFSPFSLRVVKDLSSLTSLTISGNPFSPCKPYFGGTIPGTLGGFVNLKVLELVGLPLLSGSVPSSFSKLISLQDLTLRTTNISGSVPWTFLSANSKLTLLDLSDNKFTGKPFPSNLSPFSRLQSLYLQANPFSPSNLPAGLGLLEGLQVLDLEDTNVGGAIPSTLSRLNRLSSLDLSANRFQGSVPAVIGSLKSLVYLYLSRNKFSGPFPAQILLPLRATFGYLDLSSNSFSGPIPGSTLSKMRNLSFLYLSNNKFSGVIPSISAPLQIFDLTNNTLQGPLPITLTRLSSSLTILLLGGNYLQGRIPVWLSRLSLLDQIYLNDNRFTGSVPVQVFASIAGLTSVDLSGNSITGQLPLFPTSIYNINLARNRFTGAIPRSYAALGPRYLNLNDNRLQGTIPPRIFANTQSKDGPAEIDISRNFFTGRLPQLPPKSAFLAATGNFFFGPTTVTSTASRRLFCPTRRYPGQPALYLKNNCLKGSPSCPSQPQKPFAACAAFCGTGTRAGQCGGHGICVPRSFAQRKPSFGCICFTGYKIAGRNVQKCVKA